MRGPIVLATLAAALFLGQATRAVAPVAKLEAAPTARALLEPAALSSMTETAEAVVALPPAAPELSPPKTTELQPWETNRAPIPVAAAFVYARNHPMTPLPDRAFAAMTSRLGPDPYERTIFDEPQETPFDLRPNQLQTLTRDGLCSAIVTVAQANDLPIPFFANLIWQESSFRSRTISHAGALGIAQFIPETAIEHGLMNPFEPVHALFASGRFLRRLHLQFGNLGLAAAAYNAGPQRVTDWLGQRRGLPAETRAYVVRITGNPAERWLSGDFQRDLESTLMPARAPCAEVADAVAEQAALVRISKIAAELAAAAAAPVPQDQWLVAALPLPRPKPVELAPSPGNVMAAAQKKDQSRPVAAQASAQVPARPGMAAVGSARKRIAAR